MNRIGGAVLTGVLCAALMACGGGGGGMGNGGMPVMNVSTQALLFGAFVSAGTSPAAAAVNVTNTGSGTVTFSAKSDQPWLMVAPANGTAPMALQISATLGALTPNTYVGHITVTANGAQGSPQMVTVTFTVGSGQASTTPFWGQWGANPAHTGMVGVAGNSVNNKLADIVYDPFINQEKAENAPIFGDAALIVHEQAPITDGNDVYMVVKTGSYNSCNPVGAWGGVGAPQANFQCGPNTWNTMVWNEVRFSWLNGQFLKVWNFQSDWKPEPNATNPNAGFGGLLGWEPVFHPVDTPNFIYVPGAAGTVHRVDKTSGAEVKLINPFIGVNGVNASNTFVSSPLTTDSSNNIYYNVIELDLNGGGPWDANDVLNAWLVKIAPDDTPTKAPYASLVPGAPASNSGICPAGNFFFQNPPPAFPWPPSPGAIAPAFPASCGSQRPGVNTAPVVAPNGTIYTSSRAHFDPFVSYVVAVNPDLTPKWQASLQTLLNDGCGVLVPYGPTAAITSNYCTMGATLGVDPTTNLMGSGWVNDQASSSPVALPDSSVLMGALDSYNFGRGHLFHFSSTGQFVDSFDFGWDSTPAVYAHNGTFSVVIKDNHYPASSYCNNQNSPVCTPRSAGPYYITQLDANLNIEWRFQSTMTDAQHPNGFEWCINMPAVDMNGNVYVNSEDGRIYEIAQPPAVGPNVIITNPAGKLFLNQALGAAYTPLSIGADGKLYTQNNGHLFAVGN